MAGCTVAWGEVEKLIDIGGNLKYSNEKTQQ